MVNAKAVMNRIEGLEKLWAGLDGRLRRLEDFMQEPPLSPTAGMGEDHIEAEFERRLARLEDKIRSGWVPDEPMKRTSGKEPISPTTIRSPAPVTTARPITSVVGTREGTPIAHPARNPIAHPVRK